MVVKKKNVVSIETHKTVALIWMVQRDFIIDVIEAELAIFMILIF